MLGRVTHAEHHAEVETEDNHCRTSTTNKRERLTRNGEKAYGNHHVDYGLRCEHKGKPYDEKGGEERFTPTRYFPGSEYEHDVEEDHQRSAP